MAHLKRLFVIVLLCAFPLQAQELITLTTPETKPSNTRYRMAQFSATFDDPGTVIDEGRLVIELVGQNQESMTCVYSPGTTPTATVLNNGLNKANMSGVYAGNATTGSLKFRVYHRLVAMGEAATVCGQPLNGTLTGTVP